MRKLILALGLLTLVACHQNPYDDHPGVQGPQPPPPPLKPKPKPLPGAWGLQAQNILEFTEGVTGSYPIKGTVAAPGTAHVAATGLPAGANYDDATHLLTWLPDASAGNDPNDPTADSRLYKVTFTLTSSDDPNSAVSQDVLLLVHNVAQAMTRTSPVEASGTEGTPLSQQVTFTDDEFPKGPFDATLSGFPPGDVQVVWQDKGKTMPSFQITWTPGFTTVKGNASAKLGGHVELYDPRGKRIEFDVIWTIQDSPQPPFVWGVPDVKDTNDVNFFEIAEDINDEDVPEWSVVDGPNGLTVATQEMQGAGRKASKGVVTWRNIQKADLDKTYKVTLKACVKNSTQCTSYDVNVSVAKGGK